MSKFVQLSGGLSSIVDDDWYEMLSLVRWRTITSTSGKHYASASGRDRISKRFYGEAMHRIIMDPKRDEEVDHINGNPLDNRVENLRLCTRNENARNVGKYKHSSQSKYKGVRKEQWRNDKWLAALTCDGKRYISSGHNSEIAAAQAYNKLAIQYHGEFANLNDVPAPVRREVWSMEDLIMKVAESFRDLDVGSKLSGAKRMDKRRRMAEIAVKAVLEEMKDDSVRDRLLSVQGDRAVAG